MFWPLHPFEFYPWAINLHSANETVAKQRATPGSIILTNVNDGKLRQFYIPTDLERSIFRQLYPSQDASNPLWHLIQADVVRLGHKAGDLVHLTAPAIIAALERNTSVLVAAIDALVEFVTNTQDIDDDNDELWNRFHTLDQAVFVESYKLKLPLPTASHGPHSSGIGKTGVPGSHHLAGSRANPDGTARTLGPGFSFHMFGSWKTEIGALRALASDIAKNGEAQAPKTTREKSKRKRKSKSHVSRDIEARNKWLYAQCCKGVPYDTIVLQLKSKPSKWPKISSKQGIRAAANRYAESHDLPSIPARQNL